RGQTPHEIRPRESEGNRETEHERHTDRERDQRHHSWQTIANLADGAFDEHPAAITEDQRSEDRRNPPRGGEPAGRLETEPVLNHRRPDERRYRQQQSAPELLAEHVDRMSSVFV